MPTQDDEPSTPRNGKLSIPLPFEDAIRAALKVKPPAKKPKPRTTAKKAARSEKRAD